MSQKLMRIIILAIYLLFLSGCYTTKEIIENVDKLTSVPEIVTQGIEEVPVVYTTIPEIAERADIVILGQPVKEGEVVNTARIPGESDKPDPDYFSIGQIYDVSVEEYIKGTGDKTVSIIQHQGFLVNKTGSPSVAEIESARGENKFVPLVINKNYLMFLRHSTHVYEGYSQEEIFTGIGHPWLFDISESNCVRPVDTLVEISKYYPAQPLSIFRSRVTEPFSEMEHLNSDPYPSPETDSLCAEDRSIPYP